VKSLETAEFPTKRKFSASDWFQSLTEDSSGANLQDREK